MAIQRKYNFRFTSERERFYADQVKDTEDFAERFDEFGFDSRVEFTKAIRMVFEVDEHTSTERKKHVESTLKKGTGKFRGLRTFSDFSTLKRFLNQSKEQGSGISWGRRNFDNYTMSARLSYYQRRGNRVVGEKVLVKYSITFGK